MVFFMFQIFYILSTLSRIYSNTVTSPQIRNVATKASETRLIPNRVEYRNAFHPYAHVRQNRYENAEPLKSYVIYEEYPLKIFKEWKANSPGEFSPSAPQNFLDLSKQPNAEFPPDYYFQNEPQVLQPPKPTLAYRSVYSNVIKVFDNSLDGLDRNRFQSQRYIKPFEGNIWKPQTPVEYEHYPQDIARRQLYNSPKLPENFPKVFAPNEKFHFPSFDDGVPQPPRFFYPQEGFYDTHTINYNNENTRHRDEVEILPEGDFKRKNQKKAFLCGFIKVNQRQFPESGRPCGRSDDLPIVPSEYPDYSNLPNDKIPLEHRRQHFQIKRIKRSELNQSYESRQKRNAGLGYGYSDWGSPLGYESAYEGYFNDNYPTRAGYRNSYSFRNRYQNYRNRYSSGSRYDDYDDDYQSNEDSNSRGLTGYLTNGGRRYKNRKNNDEDEDDGDDNNDNNRDDDSGEEMEQMNSNRRDANDRRNNDDSRDRRRNNSNNNHNNNNEDDDYRDNRRNNNRNNSRRNNNNRRNNDRSDNNNRNRYYSNGYSNNGYGSSYGGYGSNYGGNAGYGSSYGSNGGYGSGYGSNGGYGNGYGSNGGYGYGGYGNGFSSF